MYDLSKTHYHVIHVLGSLQSQLVSVLNVVVVVAWELLLVLLLPVLLVLVKLSIDIAPNLNESNKKIFLLGRVFDFICIR